MMLLKCHDLELRPSQRRCRCWQQFMCTTYDAIDPLFVLVCDLSIQSKKQIIFWKAKEECMMKWIPQTSGMLTVDPSLLNKSTVFLWLLASALNNAVLPWSSLVSRSIKASSLCPLHHSNKLSDFRLDNHTLLFSLHEYTLMNKYIVWLLTYCYHCPEVVPCASEDGELLDASVHTWSLFKYH